MIALTSCRNGDQSNLWLDYQITGEEGRDSITVLLRYRVGHNEGNAVALEPPAKAELDGQPLRMDSAAITGVYYETMRAAGSFGGNHQIVYTSASGQQYREEFTFSPVTLITQLPPVVMRDDLVLELDGLNPVDYVRVLLIDTSYAGREISRLDTVKNGRVLISRRDLATLSDGPIMMELARDENRPTKKSLGRLSITYVLRREFELQTPQ